MTEKAARLASNCLVLFGAIAAVIARCANLLLFVLPIVGGFPAQRDWLSMLARRRKIAADDFR